MGSSIDSTLSTIIEVTIAVVVVAAILPSVISLGAPIGADAVHPDTTTFTKIADFSQQPGTVEVASTKRNALYFNETDSVEASGPVNLSNSSWAVMASAQLADADVAPDNLTYNLYAYDNESILLQLDHGDWVAYYDNGTHSALARVDAPAPRDKTGVLSSDTAFTRVIATYNQTTETLTLSRAGEAWDTDSMDNATEARNLSIGWIGAIDEVRTFDSAVDNATITAYGDDPIQPFPDAERSSRLMFDEGSGTETAVYVDGSVATIQGAQWTEGIDGPATGGFFDSLTSTTLSEGDDFLLDSNPFSMRLVEGGYLEGAPVVFVQWHWNSLSLDIIGFIPVFAMLLVLVTLANRVQEYL